MTSTDVVDTAYGYLYKQANDILRQDLQDFLVIVGEKAKELKEIREERNHKEDDDNFMAYVPAGPERLTSEMVQQIMDGEDTTLEQPAVEVQE